MYLLYMIFSNAKILCKITNIFSIEQRKHPKLRKNLHILDLFVQLRIANL